LPDQSRVPYGDGVGPAGHAGDLPTAGTLRLPRCAALRKIAQVAVFLAVDVAGN